jgi:outer membrane protease
MYLALQKFITVSCKTMLCYTEEYIYIVRYNLGNCMSFSVLFRSSATKEHYDPVIWEKKTKKKEKKRNLTRNCRKQISYWNGKFFVDATYSVLIDTPNNSSKMQNTYI